VGCAYSNKIVFPEFFEANPDSKNPVYQTRLGVYEEGCGLDKVTCPGGTTSIFITSPSRTCRSRRCT
jgi:inositol oxygenase